MRCQNTDVCTYFSASASNKVMPQADFEENYSLINVYRFVDSIPFLFVFFFSCKIVLFLMIAVVICLFCFFVLVFSSFLFFFYFVCFFLSRNTNTETELNPLSSRLN